MIEDEGSLNGTYVNRRRVENAKLEAGDEVQIGKYRMTFLGLMATTTSWREQSGRPLTIGAVCNRLKEQFPDVRSPRSATSRTRAS